MDVLYSCIILPMYVLGVLKARRGCQTHQNYKVINGCEPPSRFWKYSSYTLQKEHVFPAVELYLHKF